MGRATAGRRAQELKRELLRPTVKLPERRASSYEQSMLGDGSYGGHRRRSVFRPFFIALTLGALSTLIPVSGTFTLQGTLAANAQPAAAVVAETAAAVVAAPAQGKPNSDGLQLHEGAGRRAVVFAKLAECPWVQLNEPSIVTIDVPAQNDLVLSASIVSIEARSQVGPAAGKHPSCRVELALAPEGNESTVLRGLPLGAAARADFPTTRSWMGAFVAQMPTDSRQALEQASAGLQSLSGFVQQLYRTYVAPRLH